MKVICQVCPHHCKLEEGQVGICRGRKQVSGVILCDNYGLITSMSLDPIEKKPLKHFYPGSKIFSIGSYGCNLKCPFCQNHSISMIRKEEAEVEEWTPMEILEEAKALVKNGNIGVAYTYNEPLIGYEFVRDTAMLVRESGMKNVVVTNGCFTKETAQAVLPYIDALNIDLKGFNQNYYGKLGGDLETVKEFIKLAVEQCHVELTTLIVPGENDTDREMQELSGWIASINKEIPLHVSRFFPAWKMSDKMPTEVKSVYHLADVAREHLLHVHEGNC